MLSIRPHLSVRSKVAVLLTDILVFITIAATVFSYKFNVNPHRMLVSNSAWALTLLLAVFLYLFGSYDLDLSLKKRVVFARLLLAVVATVVCATLINYLVRLDRSGIFGRGVLLGSFAGFLLLSACYHLFFNWYFGYLGTASERLFLTSENYRANLEKDLKAYPYLGKAHFEDVTNLDPKILYKPWSSMIVAFDQSEISKEINEKLMQVRFSGKKIMDLNHFYEQMWGKVPVYYLGPQWFIFSEGFALIANPVGLRFKRLLDVMLSTLLLFVTWPIVIATWLAVRLESSAPPIYRQTRVGKDGHSFTIYKFRSMVNDAESNGAQWASVNDTRITKVGKFIRKTRLDELPQIWNVFKGQMSFIGPRPERPEFVRELEKEIPYYNLRHMVRPGITGWAQVMYPYGANNHDAKEKLQYDLYYIKNYSLFLDLVIILRTIRVVFGIKGR